MTKKFTAAVAWLLTTFLYTINDFAMANEDHQGQQGEDGDGGIATPEIDGPGALMAIALLASLGVMAYRKAQR